MLTMSDLLTLLLTFFILRFSTLVFTKNPMAAATEAPPVELPKPMAAESDPSPLISGAETFPSTNGFSVLFGTGTFEEGSTDLSLRSAIAVKALAKSIRNASSIKVSTDIAPSIDLGVSRAFAICRQLIDAGVDSNRLSCASRPALGDSIQPTLSARKPGSPELVVAVLWQYRTP
jgi:hypothetical protein